jgi:hypothetical protein
MTESQWLACTDPSIMLVFLDDKANDRQLRLFACACCRRVWHLLTDERSRHAVEVAERFADGRAEPKERAAAHTAALIPAGGAAQQAAWAVYWATCPRLGDCVLQSCEATAGAAARAAVKAAQEAGQDRAAAWDKARATDEQLQANYLRDIFGNPFRPLVLDAAWRTATVTDLARAIYSERSFSDLPILADALEDAGCTATAILDHCRQPGDHVRGCWVLDAVLAKA